MAITTGCWKCGKKNLEMRQMSDFDKSIIDATKVGIYCRNCGSFLTMATKSQRFAYINFCKINENPSEKRKHDRLVKLSAKNENSKDLWHLRYLWKQEDLKQLINEQKNQIKDKVLVPMKDVWRMLEDIILKINENIDTKL